MNIDHPFHIDRSGRTGTAGEDDHVRDMIEQLLFTSAGERVNRPDFGSGLLQAVFSPNGPELAAAIQFTTQSALQRYLGDVIDVHALDVDAVDAVLTVSLVYSIKRTGERRADTFVRRTAS